MKINILLIVFISTAFVYSSDRGTILYSAIRDESDKSAFKLFLAKHKQHIIVTGIGLTALVISGIFNKKAELHHEKDKDLYEVYSNAPKNSDFNTLWNEYKKSADKTDRYLNLRGIFGTSAGVIGASLLISIVVEGNF